MVGVGRVTRALMKSFCSYIFGKFNMPPALIRVSFIKGCRLQKKWEYREKTFHVTIDITPLISSKLRDKLNNHFSNKFTNLRVRRPVYKLAELEP